MDEICAVVSAEGDSFKTSRKRVAQWAALVMFSSPMTSLMSRASLA